MYKYRVAFMVEDVQLEASIESPYEFRNDEAIKGKFREIAKDAAKSYVKQAREVPRSGDPHSYALWPLNLSQDGVRAPLDAFD